MIPVWTIDELRRDFEKYEKEIRAAQANGHYTESTVDSYLDHPRRFIKWLAGEWEVPSGRPA